MDSDSLFQFANNLAFISWIVLIIFQRQSWIKPLMIGTSVALLAATYSYLLITTFDPAAFENFGSLAGIMELFQNKEAVLAGWIHYLAFDLMVGLYIVSNAEKHGINRWIIVPSLLFTFMMGPLGLLSYLILRIIVKRSYFKY